MSRICVKNIGKSTSEKQLRELFSSKGEVTDVRVITSKDGKSRRFAFVGFRTDVQANEAQNHFNNTFIGMSRISVELAKKFNDKVLQDAKQKIASKKSKAPPVEASDEDKQKQPKPEPSKSGDSLVGVDATSVAGRKKAEFLEMMKSRKNSNKWANDDVAGTGTALDAGQLAVSSRLNESDNETDSSSESDSDESVNDAIVPDRSETQPAASKGLSDLEALRSKMTRKRADSVFSSSGSDSGSDDESDSRQQSDGKHEDIPQQDIQSGKGSASAVPAESGLEKQENGVQGEEEEEFEEARLFVKNLPFSCTEEEFSALLTPFGPVSEMHLPLDEEKRGKGYGFVQFMLPEHADRALAALAGEAFQGRVLHVVRAQRQKEKESSAAAAALAAARGKGCKLSSFQLKKEEERRRAMNRKEGWNAAFVRSDAVVDSLASR
jgi:multiple RNA-binding domain-containing protein 1